VAPGASHVCKSADVRSTEADVTQGGRPASLVSRRVSAADFGGSPLAPVGLRVLGGWTFPEPLL